MEKRQSQRRDRFSDLGVTLTDVENATTDDGTDTMIDMAALTGNAGNGIIIPAGVLKEALDFSGGATSSSSSTFDSAVPERVPTAA